jgi:hypothetical protein
MRVVLALFGVLVVVMPALAQTGGGGVSQGVMCRWFGVWCPSNAGMPQINNNQGSPQGTNNPPPNSSNNNTPPK